MTTLTTYPLPMQRDVALFHDTYRMPNLISTPGPLPLDRIELRIGLIKEEGVDELREELTDKDVISFDPVLVIDAIIDTIYVALGALVEMGQDAGINLGHRNIYPFFVAEELHRSAGTLAGNIELSIDALTIAFNSRDAQLAADLLRGIVADCLTVLDISGVDAQPFFDEVQRSNMSKLDESGNPIFSRGVELDGFPKGKVLKGPNYFKPDLNAIFDRLYKEDHEAMRLKQ